MTRDEALQWCVKHVEEWPEGYTPQFAPKGWSWRVCNGNGHIGLIKHCGVRFINREHWMKASRRIEVSVQLPGQIHNIPITFSVYDPQPDTTPCGQSFNELMRDLNV